MIQSSLFAGLSAVAFGYLFQVSGANLATAGVIGTVSWGIAQLLARLPNTFLLVDVIGALVVGALSESAALWRREPVPIFVVPAIIPFVPGYLVYKSMVDFLKNHFNTGLKVGLTALLAAGALGIGLALATAIFRPLLRGRHLGQSDGANH